MLKQIMAMTWKELKISFKDPGVVAWMFFQPFVLIVVLSFAMGGSFGDSRGESGSALRSAHMEGSKRIGRVAPPRDNRN